MDPEKKKRLEAAGWKAVTVAEFLNLSPEEEAEIEIRLALKILLKRCREETGSSEKELARRLGARQRDLTKIEGGDPKVSTDLILRALLHSGATPQRIGEAIAAVTITQELKPAHEAGAEAVPEIEFAATG